MSTRAVCSPASVSKGAKVLLGGEPDASHAGYPASILDAVVPGMPEAVVTVTQNVCGAFIVLTIARLMLRQLAKKEGN
mgnify:CR=1 FL=1